MLPYPLQHKTIKNINSDICRYVEYTKQDLVDGIVLDYIYRTRHGIVSHQFEQGELYQIFIKKETNKAFVLKVA